MQAISIKHLTTDAAEVILSNLCQEVIFWSFGNEYEGNFTTTEHLHCDRRRSRHYNEQKQKFLITYEVYLTHKIILFSPSFSLFHLLWSFFFFFLNLPLLGKTFRCIRNNQKTAVNEATVEAPKINAVPGVASWVCLQKWVKQHRLPSIFCHLSESGSREQQCKQIPPAVFSSIKPAQIYNPASISWVCPQDIFPMAASLSHPALFSVQQTDTASVSLQIIHQSIFLSFSPAPLSPSLVNELHRLRQKLLPDQG